MLALRRPLFFRATSRREPARHAGHIAPKATALQARTGCARGGGQGRRYSPRPYDVIRAQPPVTRFASARRVEHPRERHRRGIRLRRLLELGGVSVCLVGLRLGVELHGSEDATLHPAAGVSPACQRIDPHDLAVGDGPRPSPGAHRSAEHSLCAASVRIAPVPVTEREQRASPLRPSFGAIPSLLLRAKGPARPVGLSRALQPHAITGVEVKQSLRMLR